MNVETINNYLGNTAGVASAVGWLRDVQLGSLKTMQEIDRVCTAHHLRYFLVCGSLLGAVRHHGFVPWDDDIDIAMPREDYLRFCQVFNEHKQIPELYAHLYSATNGIWNLLKVNHRDLPAVYVDVFPVDFCYQRLDLAQRAQMSRELQQLLLQFVQTQQQVTYASTEDYHQILWDLRDRSVPHLTPEETGELKPTVFLGLEFLHNYAKFSVFAYDDVFPLQRMPFEGTSLCVVHDPELFLTYMYGDFMRLPDNLHFHTDLSQMSMSEVIGLKYFLRQKYGGASATTKSQHQGKVQRKGKTGRRH